MTLRRTIGLLGLLVILGLSTGIACGQQEPALPASVEARAVVALAEAYIGGLIEAMHTMAATSELRSGDWATMVDLVAQFEERTVSMNAWFLLPDGGYYKVATGLTGINLSDRAYFPRVMAGETTVGDLVVSRSTGRKSMILTAPIVDDQTIVGALGVTLYLDDFSHLLAGDLQLPDDFAFFAATQDGAMPVHADVDRLLASIDESGVDLTTAGSSASDLLGWTFYVGRTTL